MSAEDRKAQVAAAGSFFDRWLRTMCWIYAVAFFVRGVIHFPAADAVEWYAVSALLAIAARLP